jgi:O-antigen ligase
MAFNEIGKMPLLGHGRKVRIAWVRQLAATEHSDFLKELAHLHNDALNTLFEHGIFGLASYLSLGAGLAWLALRRVYCNTALRWSLAGMVWMHLTAGLTNMNMGHNYYGVMLALSLSMAWMLATDETPQSQVRQIQD